MWKHPSLVADTYLQQPLAYFGFSNRYRERIKVFKAVIIGKEFGRMLKHGMTRELSEVLGVSLVLKRL